MRFSVESNAARGVRITNWRDFYAVCPRKLGDKVVTLETIERRFVRSKYPVPLPGFLNGRWEYRLKQ